MALDDEMKSLANYLGIIFSKKVSSCTTCSEYEEFVPDLGLGSSDNQVVQPVSKSSEIISLRCIDS